MTIHHHPHMTFNKARGLLAPVGMRLARTECDEYRVYPAHLTGEAREAAAYYTDCLVDAYGTGLHMAAGYRVA